VTSTLRRGWTRPAGVPPPPPGARPLPGREAGTTSTRSGPSSTSRRSALYLGGRGLSDNPRPALYEARYEAIVANKADRLHEQVVTVAGKHCETDVLFWDMPLADPQPGDLLAVQSTAPTTSHGQQLQPLPPPAVVLVTPAKRTCLSTARPTRTGRARRDPRPAASELTTETRRHGVRTERTRGNGPRTREGNARLRTKEIRDHWR